MGRRDQVSPSIFLTNSSGEKLLKKKKAPKKLLPVVSATCAAGKMNEKEKGGKRKGGKVYALSSCLSPKKGNFKKRGSLRYLPYRRTKEGRGGKQSPMAAELQISLNIYPLADMEERRKNKKRETIQSHHLLLLSGGRERASKKKKKRGKNRPCHTFSLSIFPKEKKGGGKGGPLPFRRCDHLSRWRLTRKKKKKKS